MTRLPTKRNGDPDLAAIARLEAPPTGYVLLWAANPPGFGLRLSANGRRAWVVQGRLGGRAKRITIGAWGEDLGVVQERALAALAALRRGELPGAGAGPSPTLEEALYRFLELRTTLRPATRNTYAKSLRLYSPDWANRPLNGIRRDEVVDRYTKVLREKSPGTAATWCSAAQSIFSFAVGLGWIEANPFDAIRQLRVRVPPPPATRVIPPDRIPEWAENLDRMILGGDFVMPALYKLALLTGARRGELAGMRWSEIEGDWWNLPPERCKTKRGRRIPLTPTAMELVEEARRITEDVDRRAPRQAANDLVWFTGWQNLRPRKQQIGHFSGIADRMRRLTGVAVGWHDLRRTWASAAAPILADPVRRALLGHAMDGMDRHYVQISDDDLRSGMLAVEQRLLGRAES